MKGAFMPEEELVAGLDEVGWGAGAGPIVSVVVVTRAKDLMFLPKGVTDSKKLSEIRRRSLLLPLLEAAYDKGLGAVEAWEIDKLGPKWALQESYKRALGELHCVPDMLIVDGTEWGNRVNSWAGKQIIEPKADLNHVQVSMASIIAKVMRDQAMVEKAALMRKLGRPDYDWAVNKGYLTKTHTDAIEKHGLLMGPTIYEHRRSYCSKFLGKVANNG
jgi:ribonuclease HII